MRVGAHVEIVGRELSYEEAFPLLRRLGARGVELVIREGAPLNLASPDGAFLRAKRLAEENGLAICGATNGYGWSLPLTSDSPETRRRGVAAMRRALEGAALLGTDSLLTIPGYASTTYLKQAETVPVEAALERAREGLRECAAYAGGLGVSMNVEAVWNGMLRTPGAMSAFLGSIGSPWVGFYLDTGNVFPEGNLSAWIDMLAPYIRRVHVKDYTPDRAGMAAFCPLGEGVVDFPAVIRALSGLGYDGWISAEHHNDYTAEGAERSLRFLHHMAEAANAPAAL